MQMLARNWGWVALRGFAALLFGMIALFRPGLGLAALFLLFGGYAFADGVFTVVSALAHRREKSRWGSMLTAGAAGIAVGVLTLLMLRIAAFVLLYFLAAWAIVTGVAGIVAALSLRKVIRDEWLLALAGLLSVAFGLLLLAFPGLGALTVSLWIGGYASIFGLVLIGLAFRLRSWGKRHPSGEAATAG